MMEVGRTVLDAKGYPNIEISTYKCMNQLELVLCKVENPLYSAYVTIPVPKRPIVAILKCCVDFHRR